MPIQVTANDGDCLCDFAMQNGFLNCQPLRDDPANAAFLNRPLKKGDVVTVPDIRLLNVNKPVDAAHPFVKQNSPPVSIRFVHGSPDKHYLEDTETLVLNVSNFRTDKGGANATRPFPDQFEFHQEGHDDPDTFKVEVVDPAGSAPVKVVIDARMPIYSLKNGKLVVTDHGIFQTATTVLPSLKVDCALVRSAVSFRSKYLRLVTSIADFSSKPKQTLFVASIADGKGTGKATDPDNVEILDFEIRATYVIQRCPAPSKCSVSVTKPLGDESDQIRFRIAFHIFNIRGTSTPMDGLSVQKVRRCALLNLRRFYAQAAMAPRLVSADGSPGGSAVIFMDPPDDNMIVIGEGTGRGASGRNRTGQTSTLTIFDRLQNKVATVTLSKNMKPDDVANAINNALDKSIFTAEIFENPVPAGAVNPSRDVIITQNDGAPLLLGILTDDTILRSNITVVRVNVDLVNFDDEPQMRRVIRSSPGPEGVINVYSVGNVVNNKALAISFPLNGGLPSNMHVLPPILNSVLCITPLLGDPADFPVVLSHECGHILGDINHVDKADPHFASEIMTDGGGFNNSVADPARISDTPVKVLYQLLKPANTTKLINAVERLRTQSPDLLEKPW